MPNPPRLLLRLAATCAVALATMNAGEDEAVRIELPPQIEIDRLVQLVASTAGVSLQFNPQRLQGQVSLSIREAVGPDDLWRIFNQVLIGQGFATIVSERPAVYQVVPLGEAPQLAAVLPPDLLQSLRFQPGYLAVLHQLKHLAAEQAVKILGPLAQGQLSQVRALGGGRTLVLLGTAAKIAEIANLLAQLDVPGLAPVVRAFQPLRTQPQQLQAALMSAWAGLNRMGGQLREADAQIAPDGRRLVLIATSDVIADFEALARQLDEAEPTLARTYQPRWFGLDEVASLLQQVLGGEGEGGAPKLRIVADRLTSTLIVRATAAEHERVAELIARLDAAPEGARRKARTFIVKNRDVEELATTLAGMITSGLSTAPTTEPAGAPPPAVPVPPPPQVPATAQGTPANPPPLPGQPTPQTLGQTPAFAQAQGTAQHGDAGAMAGNAPPRGSTRQLGDDLVITTDPPTGRLIAVGDPQKLELLARLIAELDQRQPQVDLEVILVSMSDSQTLQFGVELAALFSRGEVSGVVSSLFGLSQPVPLDPVARTVGNAAGFSGVVLDPGDFAGVVRALETVNKGKSLIRSNVVVANYGKASVRGVLQQPFSSINAGQTVATTSFAGTSDAGTQVSISPQIAAGDHVTLDYQITLSAFVGEPTVSGEAVLPPPKRSDEVASRATIPNGYVVAMGGLSSQDRTNGESRLPVLGSLPLLGHLFKNQSRSQADSRFFVFIRANVLRHPSFQDLRYATQQSSRAAGLPKDEPEVEPQLIR